MSDQAIVQLDRAQLALSQCKTVMEAKQIADVAEAARVYLERTNASVETVNRAAEIRTLAERQMGAFLKQMPKQSGARGMAGPGRGNGVPVGNPVSEAPTLASIGITKKQSATAQKLAELPEPEFRERMTLVKVNGDSPTPSKVLGLGVARRREPTVFDLDIWKRHARGQVGGLLNSVPLRHRKAAAEFIAALTANFFPPQDNA